MHIPLLIPLRLFWTNRYDLKQGMPDSYSSPFHEYMAHPLLCPFALYSSYSRPVLLLLREYRDIEEPGVQGPAGARETRGRTAQSVERNEAEERRRGSGLDLRYFSARWPKGGRLRMATNVAYYASSSPFKDQAVAKCCRQYVNLSHVGTLYTRHAVLSTY